MSLDEETLEVVANGGPMDFEKWPSMIDPLLERLEHIVYNIFPMPQIPPEPASHRPTSNAQDPNTTNDNSNNKDTSLATTTTTTSPNPSPANSHPTLPEPLHLLLTTIKSTLRSLFATKPPHTIQRLAELIIRPTAHYHTLPAYLRAMDRVVSVTSSADIFPLQTQPSTTATHPNGAILNGAESTFVFPDPTPGSDESLGGALLTPIPWLSNVASSPEGESVSAAAAVVEDTTGFPAQGAGISAQETAGLVPSSTEEVAVAVTNGGEGTAATTGSPPPDDSEDIPHARGPSVVGVEDLGLQDGKGVEMDLSAAEGEAGSSGLEAAGQEGPQEQTGQGLGVGSDSEAKLTADGDGDISLEDAKPAGEEMAVSAETAEKDTQQA
ncbi:hypothetical protein BO70DRAFT_362616 [Aspergillus heteromorphus CBS 117.55]|uniref:PPP4R2-domain-containing protein n=1 Tax=Aspergillus heteromorphus CBS 117.55 TaxID=1448321 RepID=A0A317W610_9EURO|nr:uncharacterized protein BO70DRAFT_362616 [Aspergillus heteromorphus CBS 117.55]PWY80667.1 hypothetical protein BO70DRAFT_362616 [Aspergillus heteromorphus CBS 117.55]